MVEQISLTWALFQCVCEFKEASRLNVDILWWNSHTQAVIIRYEIVYKEMIKRSISL